MRTVGIGTVLSDRYEIVDELGSGGMGAVFLARNLRTDGIVALKVLYPHVSRSLDARERFANEARVASLVKHKNVAEAIEFFESEELCAFVMEYVDGGNLLSKMKREGFRWDQVIDLLQQIAAGLEAMHRAGIIHRDLKPENILLTREGVVKITDFGVARVEGSMTLTQHGMMVGTPKYLAPEYIEMGEVDQRGDIYALGVMAFEMCAGQSPFRGGEKRSLADKFRFDEELIVSLSRRCPPDLFAVIQKAMSVSLISRYQTAGELLEDLVRLQPPAPEPVPVDPPPLLEPSLVAEKRGSLGRSLCLSIVLIILIFTLL